MRRPERVALQVPAQVDTTSCQTGAVRRDVQRQDRRSTQRSGRTLLRALMRSAHAHESEGLPSLPCRSRRAGGAQRG